MAFGREIEALAGQNQTLQQQRVLAAALVEARVESLAAAQAGGAVEQGIVGAEHRREIGDLGSRSTVDAALEKGREGADVAAFGAGLDRAEHGCGAVLARDPRQRRQPAGSGFLVVVEKGDPAPLRRRDAGVAGVGDARTRLADVMQGKGRFFRQRRHQRAGVGVWGIVDHDQFRRQILKPDLRHQAGQRARQRRRAVEGWRDDADPVHAIQILSLPVGYDFLKGPKLIFRGTAHRGRMGLGREG